MGLFSRKRDTAEIEQLRDQIRQLTNRVDKTNDSQTELTTEVRRVAASSAEAREAAVSAAQLSSLEQRIAEIDIVLAESVDSTPAAPLPAPTQDFALADKAVLTELRHRLDRLERQIEAVDQRVTNSSTELANQISELSNEIDQIDQASEASESSEASEASDDGNATADDTADDATAGEGAGDTVGDSSAVGAAHAAIETLQASQERLANEQARYQIAFRKDLAELADRIKRST